MVNYITKLKQSNQPFGGIRRILVGNFFQLLPVPNVNSGDVREPLYRMIDIDIYIPHKVELLQVCLYYSNT